MLQLSNPIIKRIKLLIASIFITYIVVRIIQTAIYTLPHDWLFFITSDAIENFVGTAIAFSLYYYVFKLSSIWQRIIFIIFFVSALFIIALFKDFRIHNLYSVEQSFDYFTNFLGKTLLFYVFFYGLNKLDAINQYRKLELELKEARAQLLRNQMNPHFLFNAFNSLYSLCLKNSNEAAEYVLKLSGMMRYLTDEIHLNKVPLTRELNFIKAYIDIEKMRFGKDVSIQFITNANVNDGRLIEPFLLITLVENAFKHGFYTNDKKAFVNIELVLEVNELMFCVENSVFEKQHFQESKRKGKGLNNLRQRLALLYPKKSSLEINNANNRYKTELKLTLS